MSRKFTLFDLLLLLIAAASGIAWGIGVWPFAGWTALAVAAVVFASSLVGVPRLLRCMNNAWLFWRPLRPKCRNGMCTADMYTVVQITDHGAVLECQCGDAYERCGGTFMSIDKDGATVRYMKKNWLGKWIRDDRLDA